MDADGGRWMRVRLWGNSGGIIRCVQANYPMVTATYGRTGVRKRRGGPMRTLALRRCARVLRRKPRHGHVLRLRGRVGQRRTGSTDRDGSDPPVRGPGTGSGPGVFAHLPPPSWGRSRPDIPSGKATERRYERGVSTDRSGLRVSLASQVAGPIVHEPTPALEQVRAPIGHLDLVGHDAWRFQNRENLAATTARSAASTSTKLDSHYKNLISSIRSNAW